MSSITSLSINGGNNQDTVDLSDLDGLSITAQLTGGHGNDQFITGDADVTFLYSGTNNSSDSFTASGSGLTTIQALSDNTVIGLSSVFNNSVDVIDVNGRSNVRVDGTNSNDILNFSDVEFKNYDDTFQVYGGNNSDTITTSDISAGVRYQGGHGNDQFIIGDADATFLYSGTNNSSDSFSGNDSGQTATIQALSDNTVIGLSSVFNNSVDVIDVNGKSNVRVDGTNGNDILNFSDVTFTGYDDTFQVYGGNNSDTITTSNISAGVRYQGGHGSDQFIIGDADATFLYSGTNNSSDSFSGNDSGQTATILALSDNAIIGLASGFNNGVDVIDVNGKSNVRVDGTNGNDILNFSDVTFTGYDDTFQVYGGNNSDTITTSNISAGVRYQGGHGNDQFIIGDADATFLYSGTNNSSDSFSGNDSGQTATILALSDNTIIGLASGFNDGAVQVDEIDVDGHSNVRVDGTGGNDILNFADVEFKNYDDTFQIYGGNNNDTITTSDISAGVRYQGGHGDDQFIIGAADATFLYSGTNNSSDSFSGNNGGQTATILALSDNTVIGLADGFDNDVDVIDDGGKTGVRIYGTGGNDSLNLEEVQFSSTLLIYSNNNNDTVTASLDRGHTLTYDGGHGNDTLFLSLSDVEAQDAAVQAALADFFTVYSSTTPYTFGTDGPSSALDGITIQNFESVLVPLVVSGAGNYRVVRNDFGAGTADDEVEIYRDGNLIASQLMDRTSEVRVIGATNSSDSLEVDFSGGDPIPVHEVFFNGLGGSGSDELLISHGSHTDTIYNYENAHDGSVSLDGSSINYVGLEPITNTGTTTNAVFNLTEGGDVATLTDNGSTSSLSGSSFENTTFTNPTGSLTINGGGGLDQFLTGNIYSVDLDLIIDAETVTLNNDVIVDSFTSTGNTLSTGNYDDIYATAGNINITTIAGKIDVRGHLNAQNGGGTAAITLDSAGSVNVTGNVTTDGGGFTSSGTNLSVGGAIYVIAGAVDLDDHTGAISLNGDVTGGSFIATKGTTLSTGTYDDIRVSNGDINIKTSTGKIDVRGLLDAQNGGGTAAITLDSAGSVNVTGRVTTDGGGFTSSGTNLSVGGAIYVIAGAVDLDDHTGAISLNGDVTGGSFIATKGTTLSTGTYDDIRVSNGDINIKTSTGKIDVRGLLDAQNGGGTAAITLDSAGSVNVTGSVTTDGGGFTSAGTDLSIGGAVNTAGGNISWNHGQVTLQSDVSTGGGDFTSGNGSGNLTTGTYDDIRTFGGEASFDHKQTTIGGQLNTAGGNLNIALHLVSPNFGPVLFSTASGNIDFSSGSVLTVDTSAIDLVDTAPFDQFDVIKAIHGDVITSGLIINSSQDANGDDTAFVYDILPAGSSEILRLTGAPLLPIIVSGAGDYVLQLEDQGTPSTNDDEITLYRGGVEIARRAYFATSEVIITGAEGTSDSLTIDFDGGLPVIPGVGADAGNPIPIDGVTFDGLGGAGSDSLILEGGTFDSLTYNYDNANDGNIEFVAGAVTSLVNFLGLDPITDTTTAAVKTFNLLGGNDSAVLSRVDGATTRLTGSTIEETVFSTPTDLLVINGGSGTDTITVNGANLDLGTAGIDLTAETINVQTGLTAASVTTSGGNLNVNGGRDITATNGNIAFNQSGVISAGGSDLSAENSTDDASITIVAGTGNHDTSVRSVTTDGGDFISTGGRNFIANSNIYTGTGLVDLNHTGGSVMLNGNVTASTFQSDGIHLTVANTRDIITSGVLGSGEAIDINHTGTISMAGTDLVSSTTGASIEIVGGTGNSDVSVRSVTTSNGDFISTSGRNFLANSNIGTGTGLVDLNHTGGSVMLNGNVTAGAFESNGINLTMANNRDITVSGNKFGYGINVNHTGYLSLSGTDLISTGLFAGINLQAGTGSHDINLKSATTNDGFISTAGGRHLTLNGDLNAGNFSVTSIHGGTINLGNNDVTASLVYVEADAINGSAASTVSGSASITMAANSGNLIYTGEIVSEFGMVSLTASGNMNLGDVTSGVFIAQASTMTLFGSLDFFGVGFITGDLVVASSGELIFDLIAPGNVFDSLTVTGALTLNSGNTVTVDVGNPPPGLNDSSLFPVFLAFASEGVSGSISNLSLEGNGAETAKIDDVFADPAGIMALI
ncbi:hypothetical protein [Gimesia algae]|uniref:Uncharacterized protein n=1 Tax=Gimesia algae TaxID=2527971 RepID=A0A517VAB0_9PLAN|nr:hypothetical protein [Gimesia algae]QDT89942.1 hypothetical protein Pan161_15750 [Gimesia algae]